MKLYLQQYVEYNLWANNRLLDFVLNSDAILLDRNIKSSFTSLRKTFLHIWDAEYIWMERLNNRSITTWPSKEYDDLTPLQNMLNVSREWFEFVKLRQAPNFEDLCTYRNIDGKEFIQPIYTILMHCMNHSTFHRGQIVSILRSLDVTAIIPSTDLISFSRD
jgi:uncharacterized damage-inducible protein DinB